LLGVISSETSWLQDIGEHQLVSSIPMLAVERVLANSFRICPQDIEGVGLVLVKRFCTPQLLVFRRQFY
jgi:hypothetical protein